MKILLEPTGPVNWERIYCYLMNALVVEIALLADTSLVWLLFVVGSLPYDVLERSCLPTLGKVQEGSLQDEADRLENDSNNYQHDNVEDSNAFGESEWSDDGEADEDNDNSDASNGQGSDDSGDEDDSGGGEEEEEDIDDDDVYSEYDSDEEEDEEESDHTGSSEEDEEESLLNHARKVYTSNVFRAFEHEYRKSRALMVDVESEKGNERGLVFTYKLEKMGHYQREHKLTAYPCDGEMNCSCNYFSYFGILCCHAISVLECLHINEIPNCHLMRWMKNDYSYGLLEKETCQNNKRRRLITADCSGKCVNVGASKDDIYTVYQERKEDIYQDIAHIRFIFLKNAIKYDNIPFIFDKIGREDPKATKDDCYPLYYQKKQISNYTDNALVSAPLLRHARDIYIPQVFDLFRVEYKKSEYLIISIVSQTVDSSRNVCVECEVFKPGYSNKSFKVYAESEDGMVKCSCKKFDSDGILCCHAIAVLDCLCILRIPSQYIVKQFVRDASLRDKGEFHGPQYEEFLRSARYKFMLDILEKMLRKASASEEGLDDFERFLTELKDDVLGRPGESSKGD